MSGLDEAVIKNVEACKQLSKITRTSLGPNGAPQIQPPARTALVLPAQCHVPVNVSYFRSDPRSDRPPPGLSDALYHAPPPQA